MLRSDVSRIRLVTEDGKQKTLAEGRRDIENWLADVSEHSRDWTFVEENSRLQQQKRVKIAGSDEQKDRYSNISPEVSLLKRELTTYRGKKNIGLIMYKCTCNSLVIVQSKL